MFIIVFTLCSDKLVCCFVLLSFPKGSVPLIPLGHLLFCMLKWICLFNIYWWFRTFRKWFNFQLWKYAQNSLKDIPSTELKISNHNLWINRKILIYDEAKILKICNGNSQSVDLHDKCLLWTPKTIFKWKWPRRPFPLLEQICSLISPQIPQNQHPV